MERYERVALPGVGGFSSMGNGVSVQAVVATGVGSIAETGASLVLMSMQEAVQPMTITVLLHEK